MYGQEFTVDDSILAEEATIEIGKAKIHRPGTDVTITAFSRMVGVADQAAEELQKMGISCEVIFPL
jgi:pyruvate dehydrogenase E1 component beta subunit